MLSASEHDPVSTDLVSGDDTPAEARGLFVSPGNYTRQQWMIAAGTAVLSFSIAVGAALAMGGGSAPAGSQSQSLTSAGGMMAADGAVVGPAVTETITDDPTVTDTPVPSPSTTEPPAPDPSAPAPAPTSEPAPPAPPAPAPEPAPPAGEQPAPSGDFTGWSNEEKLVLQYTNDERKKYNCPALKPQSQLHAAATGHSRHMADVDKMEHDGIGDGKMEDRINASGYSWSNIGENIAAGQRNAREVVDAWIASPHHHENMVNCNFTELGVAVAKARAGSQFSLYWTQNFGRP